MAAPAPTQMAGLSTPAPSGYTQQATVDAQQAATMGQPVQTQPQYTTNQADPQQATMGQPVQSQHPAPRHQPPVSTNTMPVTTQPVADPSQQQQNLQNTNYAAVDTSPVKPVQSLIQQYDASGQAIVQTPQHSDPSQLAATLTPTPRTDVTPTMANPVTTTPVINNQQVVTQQQTGQPQVVQIDQQQVIQQQQGQQVMQQIPQVTTIPQQGVAINQVPMNQMQINQVPVINQQPVYIDPNQLGASGSAMNPNIKGAVSSVAAAAPMPHMPRETAMIKDWMSRWQKEKSLPASATLLQHPTDTNVYFVHCGKILEMLLPKAVQDNVDMTTVEQIIVEVRIRLSLFDLKSLQFFGCTCVGPPNHFQMSVLNIAGAVQGSQRFTVDINRPFAFPSGIIDENAVLVAELTMNLSSPGNQQQAKVKTEGGTAIGFAVFPFHNSSIDDPGAPRTATVYGGTVRSLIHQYYKCTDQDGGSWGLVVNEERRVKNQPALEKVGAIQLNSMQLGPKNQTPLALIRTYAAINCPFPITDTGSMPCGLTCDAGNPTIEGLKSLTTERLTLEQFELRLPDPTWLDDMRFTLLHIQESFQQGIVHPPHPGDKPLTISSLRFEFGVHNRAKFAAGQTQSSDAEHLVRIALVQAQGDPMSFVGRSTAPDIPFVFHKECALVVELVATVEFSSLSGAPSQDVRLCWSLILPEALSKAEVDAAGQSTDSIRLSKTLFFGPGASPSGHKILKPLNNNPMKGDVKRPHISFNIVSQPFLNWIRAVDRTEKSVRQGVTRPMLVAAIQGQSQGGAPNVYTAMSSPRPASVGQPVATPTPASPPMAAPPVPQTTPYGSPLQSPVQPQPPTIAPMQPYQPQTQPSYSTPFTPPPAPAAPLIQQPISPNVLATQSPMTSQARALDRRDRARAAEQQYDAHGFIRTEAGYDVGGVCDIRLEEQDPNIVSEINFQFVAYRVASAGIKRISFAFRFYTFKGVRTPAMQVEYASGMPSILHAANDHQPVKQTFVVNGMDANATTAAATNRNFVEYLYQRCLEIEVWDEASSMQMGSCNIPLRQLLRQQKKQARIEAEFPVFDVMGTTQIGGLQIMVSNSGKPFHTGTNAVTGAQGSAKPKRFRANLVASAHPWPAQRPLHDPTAHSAQSISPAVGQLIKFIVKVKLLNALFKKFKLAKIYGAQSASLGSGVHFLIKFYF